MANTVHLLVKKGHRFRSAKRHRRQKDTTKIERVITYPHKEIGAQNTTSIHPKLHDEY